MNTQHNVGVRLTADGSLTGAADQAWQPPASEDLCGGPFGLDLMLPMLSLAMNLHDAEMFARQVRLQEAQQ